jgi:hypothetical protein
MNSAALLTNLLNPPVLFFFLGLLAVFIRSDLNIPQQISKFFSLYLLFSLGLKGGIELSHSTFSNEIAFTLIAAMAMAIVVPLYAFRLFKRKFNLYDAAGLAATYGSVSAVTFIAATNFLTQTHTAYGGHMVAALALMESPAIMIAVILVRRAAGNANGAKNQLGDVIHESLTNGSVVLIIGSLLIGFVCGEKANEALKPFSNDIFKGMLAFFLLDMGLLAGKRISSLKNAGFFGIMLGIIIPLVNAALAIGLSLLLGIGQGNALLLTILCASASYIAVPAAMSIAVPESNPGVYVPMALAITFPFNIIIGIPLYYSIIQSLIP